MNRLLLLAGLLLAPAVSTAEPSSLELADRLPALGDHQACAVEALRHAYLRPEERASGFERAALCLGLAGRFEDASRLMLELTNAGELAPRAPAALPHRGVPPRRRRALLRWRREPRSRLGARAPHPGDARLARGPVRGGRQAPARAAARRGRHPRRLDRRGPRLPRALARPASEVAWLAAALSTAVPGLGRVYLGRWQDGLMSLLLVGAPAGLAAHGFHEQGWASVRGWVLGALAAVLYVGNVYGSAVGALVYNDEQRERLLEEVDEAYRRRLDP